MKINTNFKNIIKSPLFLLISSVTMIVIISLINSKIKIIPSKETNNPTTPLINTQKKITPILGSIKTESSVAESPIKIEWTSTDIATPDYLDTYIISQNFINSSNSDTISQKFGFKKEEEQESIDENFRVWSNIDSVLSQNFIDNEMIYISNKSPQITNERNSEDTYKGAANKFIKDLLGEKIFSESIVQSIQYFDQQNTTKLTDDTTATVIQISYYQKIEKYPLTINTHSGAPINIVLDKKLGLVSLSARGLYGSIKSLGKLKTTSLENQIKNPNTTVTRINSSNYDEIDKSVMSLKNIILKPSQIKIAYFSVNEQLIPVYLIEGVLRGSDNTEQIGLFIINTLNP